MKGEVLFNFLLSFLLASVLYSGILIKSSLFFWVNIGIFIYFVIQTLDLETVTVRSFLVYFFTYLNLSLIFYNSRLWWLMFFFLLSSFLLKYSLYRCYISIAPKKFIRWFNLVIFSEILSLFYLTIAYFFDYLNKFSLLLFFLINSGIYFYFFHYLFKGRWKHHLQKFKLIYYIYLYLSFYLLLTYLFPIKYVVLLAFIVSSIPFFKYPDWSDVIIIFGGLNYLIFFIYFYFLSSWQMILLELVILTILFLKRFFWSLSLHFLFFTLLSFGGVVLLFFKLAGVLNWTNFSYFWWLLIFFLFSIKFFFIFLRRSISMEDNKEEETVITSLLWKINEFLKYLFLITIFYSFAFLTYPFFLLSVIAMAFLLFIDGFFEEHLTVMWWYLSFPYFLILKVIIEFKLYHNQKIFYFPFFFFFILSFYLFPKKYELWNMFTAILVANLFLYKVAFFYYNFYLAYFSLFLVFSIFFYLEKNKSRDREKVLFLNLLQLVLLQFIYLGKVSFLFYFISVVIIFMYPGKYLWRYLRVFKWER